MRLIELRETTEYALNTTKDINEFVWQIKQEYWGMDGDQRAAIIAQAADIKSEINQLNELDQLMILLRNPIKFEYIKNPSDAVIKFALAMHGENIARLYKKNIPVTDTYIKIAIGSTLLALKHIKNPSEQIMVSIVKKRPKALKYIMAAKKKFKDSTRLPDSVIAAALSSGKPGTGLKYLVADKLITKQEAQALFPRSIDAFDYIDNPTEEQQIILVNRSVSGLRKIIDRGITPSANVIVAAITYLAKKSAWHLRDIIHLFKYEYIPVTSATSRAVLTSEVFLANPDLYKKLVLAIYPDNTGMQQKWLRFLGSYNQ